MTEAYFKTTLPKPKKQTKAHRAKMQVIADEIKALMVRKGFWEGSDARIYFNGVAYDARTGATAPDMDPRNSTEYGNPDTVCVVFDGCDLYEALNYGDYNPITDRYSWTTANEIDTLLEKHGYYKEQGHAWNFSIFPRG